MILSALALLAAGQVQAAPAPPPASAETVRCVEQTTLGSRVPRKLCRTEQERAAAGERKDRTHALAAFHPKNGGVGFTNN
ncbi:hypothetical protein LK533_09825 [Sphingomonas sp. PL-96]|uniref:hypothetical protein n=1 Tax=Sphingomonas sp. PL-96 TaxID=2887201 RepID=UPI001E2E959E|nr:hypothetical protein [Sphingomonas sp. PL-96]MCC2976969.1 hypothetical protein [Sphingomonas sp. PL-96]